MVELEAGPTVELYEDILAELSSDDEFIVETNAATVTMIIVS